MKYTQKQELLVSRYLREVGEELADLPHSVRERVLLRLKARITKEFDEVGEGAALNDEEVLAVLRLFGTPAEMARDVLNRRQSEGQPATRPKHVYWLGVCQALADRFDVSETFIRALFLVAGLTGPGLALLDLGLRAFGFMGEIAEGGAKGVAWPGVPGFVVLLALSGPVVLVAYLAVYFEMYLTSEEDMFPRISKRKVAMYLLGTAGGVLGFHVATQGALAAMIYLYMRITEKGAPVLGQWGWLEADAGWMFFAALCALMPLALFSALPLSNRWDQTGKRLVQAGVALYALVLCLGIASALVGVILLVVEAFTK